MIVNRYETKPYFELHFYTVDTFVLWNIGKFAKKIMKKEKYEDLCKYVLTDDGINLMFLNRDRSD